ncbi:MAG: alcohol dehydrogenase catalytic domain-containing protein [Armatimonas sp.]
MKQLQVGAGRSFEILEVPIPMPGPGEALLKIEAVTTCPQWDLHLRHNEPMFAGHQFHYPYTPGQPGHEATGTVEAVGAGVAELSVGDRVSAWRDAGHNVPGCYAQYVVHKAESLIHVPNGHPAEALAPVELAMCVGASFLMLRQMQLIAGRRFGVMGLGPAGLIALQMARAEGATEVIGFDLSAQRREKGLELGLTEAWDSREVAAAQIPLLDTSIDCVGAKATVEWLLDRTRENLALFGVQREDYTFAVRHYTKRLLGYSGHSRAAAEYAVGLIERGALNLAPLITHNLPLEEYDEAIDLLERQEAIKVCFWPWR